MVPQRLYRPSFQRLRGGEEAGITKVTDISGIYD